MPETGDMKLVIVIPAYNEAAVIGRVIQGLTQHLDDLFDYEVIVVDDGSVDDTSTVARNCGVRVVRHKVNRGLGGAIGTGLKAALLREADVVVTFDADGQHRPEDVDLLVKPLVDGLADVVIGSRLLNHKGMPFVRIVINWMANLLTFLLYGIWTTDSQSGLRAFSREATQKMRLRTNRMEVSSEILGEIHRNRLRLIEVAIPPVYTDYSLKKGQTNLNGINVFVKLLLRRLME